MASSTRSASKRTCQSLDSGTTVNIENNSENTSQESPPLNTLRAGSLPATPRKRAAKRAKTPAKPSAKPVAKLTRPAVNETWSTFGTKAVGEYIRSAATMEDYKTRCGYFHAWLGIIARGLSIDELNHVFTECLPAFLQRNPFERKTALEEFEAAYNRFEGQMLSQFRAYASAWLESPGGSVYNDAYLSHRARRTSASPAPTIPDYENITQYDGKECLNWELATLIDIWLPCLAGVHTQPAGGDNIMGWVPDPSGRWLEALKLVAASVIIDLAKLRVTSGKEGFCTARAPVRAILRKYMTFLIDGDDLGAVKYTLFLRSHGPKVTIDHTSFQAALTSSQSTDLATSITSALLETDSLGITPRQQQDIEDNYMTHDSNIVSRAKDIERNLLQQHAAEAVALQRESGFKYVNHSFFSLRAPVIAPEEESTMARSYLSKGTFGRIGQIRTEVELEKKQLLAIVVHATTRSRELDRELALLEESEKMHASMENLVKSELAKMKEKKQLLEAKKAADRAHDVGAVAAAEPAGTLVQEYLSGVDPALDAAVQSLMAFEDATDI